MNGHQGASETNGEAINRLWRIGVNAAILAAIANLVVMIAGKNLLNIPFLVPPLEGTSQAVEVSLLDVVLSSILPALGATVLFVILRQVSPHPVQLFFWIATALLLASFLFLMVETDMSTKICLALMHVITAGIIMWLLTRPREMKHA
jgi:hypothetical protein